MWRDFYGAAALHSGAHLFGFIVATLLGIASYKVFACVTSAGAVALEMFVFDPM